MDHGSGVAYPNAPPQSDGRDQATVMPEYYHAKFQNIIRMFRHQDWLREFLPPKLKNRGPRLLDDDTPWFDWPETVSPWEAFSLYRTGRSLRIPSLVKFVSTRWIAEKILHAGDLSNSVDHFDPDSQSRTQSSTTKDGGLCVCAHCVCSAPRVLLFSLEEDIKDRELEYVARQKLIGVFGVGWCTSEFASLPPHISESILMDLLKRVTPQDSLSLLFAAEQALQTLAQSDHVDSPTLRRILTTARGRIEDIICKELELCFKYPEWETLVESCRLSKDPIPESVDKLKWVLDAISRVGHVKVSEGDGQACYLDKLHHLLLKLLPADIRSSKALHPFPDNNIQALQDPNFQSATNTLVVNITPPDPPGDISSLPERPPSNFLSLNSVYSSQGVTESILYSHASSRTISTDYGMFYTRHALDWSPSPSPFGEKITLSPSKKDVHDITSQKSVIGTFETSGSGGSKFAPKLSWLPPTPWEGEDKMSRLEYSGNSLEVSESISTSYNNYRLSSATSSSMSYHQSLSPFRAHIPHPTTDIDSVELAVESSLAWVLQQSPFRLYSEEIQQHLRSTKTYSITSSEAFYLNGEGQGEVASTTGAKGSSQLPSKEPSGLFSFLTLDEVNGEINHPASSAPITATPDTLLTEEHPLKLQQKIAEMESTVETLKAELSQRDAQLRVYRKWLERIKEEKKFSDDVNELMDALVLADYPMQISRLREISDKMDYFDNDDDI